MKIGEVCLMTRDVVRLADFYKRLLKTENGSSDPVHQVILADETMLTIYNDGAHEPIAGQNICLAFTVDDLDAEYQRLIAMGANIVDKPSLRPWGASNMSFLDPDGHIVCFRSLPKQPSIRQRIPPA